MATVAVMGIIVAAVMSVLFAAYRQTGVVLNRRDVLTDGQFAMQQMAKQFRQTSEINESSVTSLDVDMYSGTVAMSSTTQIAWRTTGAAAPYTLETQTDGGAWRTVTSSLTDPSIFTYTPHDGVIDQVTITLSLGTNTTTIRLVSDVEMRNL
jgi:type II secretory pathway pseudopilin PulG